MLKVNVRGNVIQSLRKYQQELEPVLVSTLSELRDIIANVAVTKYMRDVSPGEVTNPASRTLNAPLGSRFKSRNDTMILRRLTGRLAHSILGNQGGLTPAFRSSSGNETIHVVDVQPGQVTLTFGSRTPYAAIHEYGGIAGRGVNIQARPYLHPAMNEVAETGIPGRLFDKRLNELASMLDMEA